MLPPEHFEVKGLVDLLKIPYGYDYLLHSSWTTEYSKQDFSLNHTAEKKTILS